MASEECVLDEAMLTVSVTVSLMINDRVTVGSRLLVFVRLIVTVDVRVLDRSTSTPKDAVVTVSNAVRVMQTSTALPS